MRHVRERNKKETCERESEKEGRMTWTFEGVGILTWRYLKEDKKFLSVPPFNLY
jgi:hypothetical protein